jgi:hypothetical protein
MSTRPSSPLDSSTPESPSTAQKTRGNLSIRGMRSGHEKMPPSPASHTHRHSHTHTHTHTNMHRQAHTPHTPTNKHTHRARSHHGPRASSSPQRRCPQAQAQRPLTTPRTSGGRDSCRRGCGNGHGGPARSPPGGGGLLLGLRLVRLLHFQHGRGQGRSERLLRDPHARAHTRTPYGTKTKLQSKVLYRNPSVCMHIQRVRVSGRGTVHLSHTPLHTPRYANTDRASRHASAHMDMLHQRQSQHRELHSGKRRQGVRSRPGRQTR